MYGGVWEETKPLSYGWSVSGPMAPEAQDLSRDVVFQLLSSPRRRFVLYYLREHGGETELEDITRALAAWETGKPAEDLGDDDEKRVYVSLYQTHIPKLEENGIVEYDPDTTRVSLTDAADQVDRYLTVRESPVPWQTVYLTVAVAALALTGLVTYGVGPFADLNHAVLSAVVVTSFSLLAIGQFVYDNYLDRSIPEELEPE